MRCRSMVLPGIHGGCRWNAWPGTRACSPSAAARRNCCATLLQAAFSVASFPRHAMDMSAGMKVRHPQNAHPNAARHKDPRMGKLSLAGDFPRVDDAAWKALAEKALKGADFDEALVSRTYDGLIVKPLYTRNDEIAPDSAGVPGAAPYTRGFDPDRNTPPWHIRQLHSAADPSQANAEILRDLKGGVTAIALQIAAPGQAGVEVRSTDDLERTLDGVAMDMAGVWLEAGHNAFASAQMLQDVWNGRGHKASAATGGFGADPLGALALTGGLNMSLEQAMADAAELATTTCNSFENVTALRADARPYHGGGGSDAEELACLCATVVAYLRAMEASGLAPLDGLPQIELALAVDQDFFTNITKLRAARALVARIADASGAADAVKNMKLHAR